jgi:hypothetical protein
MVVLPNSDARLRARFWLSAFSDDMERVTYDELIRRRIGLVNSQTIALEAHLFLIDDTS